MLHDIFDGY
jgi:hypothetical protein